MNLEINNPVLAVVYAWVKSLAIDTSSELRQKAKEMTEEATRAYLCHWNSNSGWTVVFEVKDKAARLEAEATKNENMICFRNLWIFCGWQSMTWTTEMILVLKKELEENVKFYKEYREFSEPSNKSIQELATDRALRDKKLEYTSSRNLRIKEEIEILQKLERLGELLRAHTYPKVDQDEAGNILADFYHQILTGKKIKPF